MRGVQKRIPPGVKNQNTPQVQGGTKEKNIKDDMTFKWAHII